MAIHNELLLELLQVHGASATIAGDFIHFSDSKMKVHAWVPKLYWYQTGEPVQLHILFDVVEGLRISEIFVGVGDTEDEAVLDAFRNFSATTLHVLLSSLLNIESDHAYQEEWTIGGNKRQVIVGDMYVHGTVPAPSGELATWYENVVRKIRDQHLGPEIHWIRVYCAQTAGKSAACEVLLDNSVWNGMQTELASIKMPYDSDFYSCRIFLVVDGDRNFVLKPEAVVRHLTKFIAEMSDALQQDDVYDALVYLGIPEQMARRAYVFTQVAWGRILTDEMEVKGSNEYYCFDVEGEVIEAGLLSEEPYFLEATRLARRYKSTPAYYTLATTSADVHAINDALRKGAVLKQLELAPVGVLFENATQAGQAKVQKHITDRAAAIKAINPPTSDVSITKADVPRWKFWKR